jgi:altronate hydrolase
MKSTLRLSDKDNVAVALKGLTPGDAIEENGVTCGAEVPPGHKVALSRIDTGRPIVKFGQIIGFASRPIEAGEHVHTHNVEMGAFARDYAVGEDARPVESVQAFPQSTFEGILRPDGRVGTRNYIGILPTVSCSVSVARFIADAFSSHRLADFPHVDGVLALSHGTGCSLLPQGEGLLYLQRALAGYARHPNFAGAVLVGLGCEVNQVNGLMASMGLVESPQLRTVTIQHLGGTRETVRRGIEAVQAMLPEANRTRRTRVPASHIVLGLECGGSDAYSGISANPALGAAVDLLVRQGGTAILSETPEIYGAEHLLTRRAVRPEVAEKLLERIRWWEEYTAKLGGDINNNPTPGNKAGGLTTIFEKSLGAVAKGGLTNLEAVYEYGETVSAKGLVFMDTPGYDVVSVTGMVAGGANMIGFTTGRGSVCGFSPVPTIKLASNTLMCRQMKDDMDMDCGPIVEGKKGIQEAGESVFRLILDTASGKKTKSELLGFGESEFVPWQMGPVM